MVDSNNNGKSIGIIAEKLLGTPYCAMNTCAEKGKINSRFMLFANNDSLDTFYLMTNKHTDKTAELKKHPQTTLSILTEAENVADYRETIVKAAVTILDDFNAPQVQSGLQLLAQKLPMVQGLIDSGGLGNYVVIMLHVSELKHCIYGEIMAQVPPAVIAFDKTSQVESVERNER